jgi:hypothetical protein
MYKIRIEITENDSEYKTICDKIVEKESDIAEISKDITDEISRQTPHKKSN